MRLRLATRLIALTIAGIPAMASTLAINFSNTTGEPLSSPPFTLGWAFEVDKTIRITSLSLFDSGQDGLAEEHPIGLWDSAGTLILSATVEAGTANPLVDKFRAVAVAPTLLEPGSYRIGALFATASDSLIFPTFTENFSTAPAITFIRGAAVVGPSLANPTPTFFNMGPAYFGPNFEYQAVPEPGSMALVGTAALVLLFARRRKRNEV